MGSKSIVRKGLGVALVVIGLDQATKWWIVETMMRPPRSIPVTPFFNLVMGWNRGVSFGLFNQEGAANVWILVTIAAVIVIILLGWLRRTDRMMVGMAIGLVIGGAVGNAIDRLRFGAVADFLDFHLMGYHWPAFNVADSAITIGAGLLVADALFRRGEKPKNMVPNRTDE